MFYYRVIILLCCKEQTMAINNIYNCYAKPVYLHRNKVVYVILISVIEMICCLLCFVELIKLLGER